MLSDDDNVCYLIGQVFGSSGNTQTSTILEAVSWALENGADVINMSLGGPNYLETANTLFEQVKAAGKVVIAAAGNDGSDALSYPASYPSVVSVAAVDEAGNKALFSQFNEHVNIAGTISSIERDVSRESTLRQQFCDSLTS